MKLLDIFPESVINEGTDIRTCQKSCSEFIPFHSIQMSICPSPPLLTNLDFRGHQSDCLQHFRIFHLLHLGFQCLTLSGNQTSKHLIVICETNKTSNGELLRNNHYFEKKITIIVIFSQNSDYEQKNHIFGKRLIKKNHYRKIHYFF